MGARQEVWRIGDSVFLIKSISIVIPAFNEEKRILPTIRKIDDYLRENAEESEIIIVNDGSIDNTSEIIGNLSEGNENIKLLNCSSNKGKGFSVKTGVLNSACDLVLFSDADLSTPIEEVEKFLPWIEAGYDIVIGSRALTESEIIEKQSWYRQSMGKIFNLLVRTIVLGGIYDTQCGFKLFRSGPAKEIFEPLKTEGFAFDVEALLRAQRMGYQIKEVPVRWINSPQSKVRMLRDSFRMFIDLLRIRFLRR